MSHTISGDQLHRSIKLALDSGEAPSINAAERLFQSYRLQINVGPEIATSPTLQATLLTAINTGRRCFLGGVQVVGLVEAPMRLPWRNCKTLADAIIDLQGTIAPTLSPEIPRITLGTCSRNDSSSPFAVQATFDGWTGGVVPTSEGFRLSEEQECTPAGILAGALAVAEAFQFVRGNNIEAGHRSVGMSLWNPNPATSWMSSGAVGPPLEVLPEKLWLIGLGHLGQAYLWTLGFLPYGSPHDVQLVLQDIDAIELANDSTSPLTQTHLIGQKKTRAMAHWCEARGFQTKIVERRFTSDFNVADHEPKIALCGVDNALARASLEEVGFRRIVEAGLGKGLQEYLAFQIHTFPARRLARDRWDMTSNSDDATVEITQRPAYQALAAKGIDQCGLTMLAGRSVGASFVGTVVATLVIGEVLRIVLGEEQCELIDGSLRTLDRRQVIPAKERAPFNPGYIRASQLNRA